MEKRMAPASVEPEDRARKRRKQSAPKNDDKVALVTLDAQRLLDQILRRKDRSRYVHREFKTLPDRGSYPDYYEEITEPIALDEIQHKLANREYTSIEGVKKDLILMCENAKIYNEPKSQIFKDANVLRKIVDDFESTEGPKPVVTANGRTPHKRAAAVPTPPVPEPVTGAKVDEAMIRIVDGLLNTVDETTGEVLFESFRNLVSRKDYPEYYKLIKEPMSLNAVRKRILAHKYNGWSDFERDLSLVVTNAEEFNEEGSDIVKLARQLKTRYEAAILRERGPAEKPAHSGIKLKLNMKHDSHAPSSTPKLKLTLRNPRISPDEPPSTSPSTQTPRSGSINGNSSKVLQPNGIPNGRNSAVTQRSQSSKAPQAPKATQHHSPIPTPPVIETPPHEVKTEPNGVATRNRRSPAGTPKPTKILPVRKSRTPALLPEAESITVVPRSHQPSPGAPSHLSPTAPAQPAGQPSAPADSAGVTGMPVAAPGEARATTSPAVQPNSQPGTLASGIDPRFRPPGKGVEDALIANITAATHPNLKLMHPVEHNFPADPAKLYQNHVVFFDAANNILLVTLTLGPTLQGRNYNASITVNGHRLYFNTMPQNPNSRKAEQSTLYCDVRLFPGRVTHIEVMLVAAVKGAKPGMPEQEQEKFTLDAFLQYE